MNQLNLDPRDDGVTHINVYSKGATNLGRALSNFSHQPFYHPQYGWFNCIEGLWYWLKTGRCHEIFRTVTGYQAKTLGRTYAYVHLDTFQKDVCMGINEKIASNHSLIDAMYKNQLPYVHYYYFGSVDNNPKVVDANTPENSWVLDHIIEIDRRLKNGEIIIPSVDLRR